MHYYLFISTVECLAYIHISMFGFCCIHHHLKNANIEPTLTAVLLYYACVVKQVGSICPKFVLTPTFIQTNARFLAVWWEDGTALSHARRQSQRKYFREACGSSCAGGCNRSTLEDEIPTIDFHQRCFRTSSVFFVASSSKLIRLADDIVFQCRGGWWWFVLQEYAMFRQWNIPTIGFDRQCLQTSLVFFGASTKLTRPVLDCIVFCLSYSSIDCSKCWVMGSECGHVVETMWMKNYSNDPIDVFRRLHDRASVLRSLKHQLLLDQRWIPSTR